MTTNTKLGNALGTEELHAIAADEGFQISDEFLTRLASMTEEEQIEVLDSLPEETQDQIRLAIQDLKDSEAFAGLLEANLDTATQRAEAVAKFLATHKRLEVQIYPWKLIEVDGRMKVQPKLSKNGNHYLFQGRNVETAERCLVSIPKKVISRMRPENQQAFAKVATQGGRIVSQFSVTEMESGDLLLGATGVRVVTGKKTDPTPQVNS